MLLLVLVVACRVPWFRHQRRQEGGPAPLAWAGVVAGGRLRRPSRQIYVSWLRSERECRLLLSLVRLYWYEVRCILFCLSTAHNCSALSSRAGRLKSSNAASDDNIPLKFWTKPIDSLRSSLDDRVGKNAISTAVICCFLLSEKRSGSETSCCWLCIFGVLSISWLISGCGIVVSNVRVFVAASRLLATLYWRVIVYAQLFFLQIRWGLEHLQCRCQIL